MKSDLISDLNNQIATIDGNNIKEHMERGDLYDWLKEWRIKTGGIAFALYEQYALTSVNLTWDELKKIILEVDCKESETWFVKGEILGLIGKKMEEKKNEILGGI